MNTRLRNILKQFDSKDTVDHILDFLDKQEKETKVNNEKELSDLKNLYENGYFVYIKHESVFGKEVEFWKINDIEFESKTVNWENCYKIKNDIISINLYGIHIINNVERHFIKEEFNELQKITEKEYNEILEESKLICNNLKNIISKYN